MAGPTIHWVWAACIKRAPQVVTASWLAVALGVDEARSHAYIATLRRHKCLTRCGGDGLGVRYTVNVDAVLPDDARGVHRTPRSGRPKKLCLAA